jgi:hypothetical protein
VAVEAGVFEFTERNVVGPRVSQSVCGDSWYCSLVGEGLHELTALLLLLDLLLLFLLLLLLLLLLVLLLLLLVLLVLLVLVVLVLVRGEADESLSGYLRPMSRPSSPISCRSKSSSK